MNTSMITCCQTRRAVLIVPRKNTQKRLYSSTQIYLGLSSRAIQSPLPSRIKAPHSISTKQQASNFSSSSVGRSIANSSMEERIQVSPGVDRDAVLSGVKDLVGKGKWLLNDSGLGIERTFHFKGFKGCWDFMNAVAAECKKQRHHPEWTNIYNKTHIVWTTHSPKGLSDKDITMARICDEKAAEFGEVEVKNDEGKGSAMGKTTKMEAGDCCRKP